MGNNYNWEEQYSESERIADERFEAALKCVHIKPPKLNSAEFEILEFCHSRDMRKFLKEEFEKHPIRLNESGELIGRNPFDVERENDTDRNGQYGEII